jgi:methionine-rich copper-binding protein CopC
VPLTTQLDMRKMNHAKSSPAARMLSLFALGLALCAPVGATRASTPDPDLLIALESIWELERPGISTLSENFQRKDGSTPARFETDVRDALAYLQTDAEQAEVEYARKRFSAVQSPWGAIPRLDLQSARLLEVTLPRKRYLVLSGTGEGLFRIGDWQRFGFLHVVDVSQSWAPLHYPLVAEAGLRERVIGRLPGSPVLNYLRLVPSRWRDASTIDAYEVQVYALNSKGAERALNASGQQINFLLSRDNAERRWQISAAADTPVTHARDLAKASFTAPPSEAERGPVAAPATAPAASPAATISPTASAASPSTAPTAASAAVPVIQPAAPAVAPVATSTPPASVHLSADAPAVKASEIGASPAALKPEASEGLAGNNTEATLKDKARSEAEDAAEESAESALKKKLSGFNR